MDVWVKENPKVASYIIILSAVTIAILVLFFYYYNKTQEYMSMVDRKLLAESVKGKRRERAKDAKPKEVDDEEGFKIFEEKWEKPEQ